VRLPLITFCAGSIGIECCVCTSTLVVLLLLLLLLISPRRPIAACVSMVASVSLCTAVALATFVLLFALLLLLRLLLLLLSQRRLVRSLLLQQVSVARTRALRLHSAHQRESSHQEEHAAHRPEQEACQQTDQAAHTHHHELKKGAATAAARKEAEGKRGIPISTQVSELGTTHASHWDALPSLRGPLRSTAMAVLSLCPRLRSRAHSHSLFQVPRCVVRFVTP